MSDSEFKPIDPELNKAGSELLAEELSQANETAPAKDAKPKAKIPTKLLMTCAAIGVVGGAILAPVSILGSSGIGIALPFLYSFLMMVRLLPGSIAQALLKKPGVALLTMVVAGLINIPFSAHGVMMFLNIAAVGLLQEILFLVLRYKNWQLWVRITSNVLVSLVIAYLGWRVLAGENLNPLISASYWLSAIVSAVLITLLADWIANQLAKMGLAKDKTR